MTMLLPIDATVPLRRGRSYGAFLVEACAVWTFLQEGRIGLTRADFVADVAAEIQEEGEELASTAVDALFRDGFFWLEGPYVRCAFAISDLTEQSG